jgi:hypothetical protein
LLGDQKIDDTLIVSETSLAFIPKNKFHVTSWYIFDEFMDYATDVFTTTVASLIKNGYIRIREEEVKILKTFGIVISTSVDYLIQLAKNPSEKYLVGWLEERIFEQFKYSNLNKLDEIIYGVLNEMFDKDHNLTNPGKIFTLEVLKHQRLNLFEFNQKENWISNSVTMWYNKNSINHFKPRLFKVGDFNIKEIEIMILRKIIKTQFGKFQNLGG